MINNESPYPVIELVPRKKKISARKKGNSYELVVIKRFKELGFNCASSRLMSKALDDAKVDIYGLDDWNVQCKAVEKLGSVHTILDSMPKDEKINLVFHKKNHQGTIVSLKEEDFFKILKQMIKYGIIKIVPDCSL